MRVVVAGLGSIGRRHLRNIRAIEPDAHVVVLRHSRADAAVPDGADAVVFELEDAVAARADVAFVCGPTTEHAHAGVALARSGAHLFVEKPLAADAADAAALVEAARAAGRALVVGYNLRFLPSLRALRAALVSGGVGRAMSARAEVGQYLPDWRPGTDYRTTNTAVAALGGGIELELSHELDYVRWLLGETVAVDAVLARTSDLEIDVDDTAEIIMHCASGALASVHMDMTQRAATRTCRIAGTAGTLTWDALAGEVRRYSPQDGWTTIHAGDGDRNAMYADEVAHVFACARGQAEPLVDGADGLRVVQIAQAARRSSREGRRIGV